MLRAHGLVTLAVLATFIRAVPYPLQSTWDDERFITDNPLAQAVSLANLRAIFAKPHFEAYHPLHLLSYWLDVPWFGAEGAVLHATNLALWALAINVLLAALARLELSVVPACGAALLVALHPVQVEAVSWAAGRKDVLAMLFCATTLLLHVRASTPWDRYAWLSRGAFVLAVLSKTSVLPLPGFLLLLDMALRRRTLRAALVFQWPALALTAAAAPLVVSIWSENQMLRDRGDWLSGAPLRWLATVGHQLTTALFPSDNAPMYDVRAVHEPQAADLTAVTLWLGLLAFSVMRKHGPLILATAGTLLMLLPVSNVVPMYFPYQDRYLSLALVPLSIGAAGTLEAAKLGRPTAAILAALVVLPLAARCVQYQGVWQSERRLWGHAVQTQPNAFYAWMKLGEVRRKAGDLEGAIRAYGQLKHVDPANKLGHAALLHAVALRDERMHGLTPSRAERYARAYYEALDDAQALQDLAGQMLQSGHLRALELPLGWALSLQRIPDPALEQAAATQFEAGRESLGLFYYQRMRAPSKIPALTARARAARARVTDLPLFH